jgi:hypothetical protein
MPSKSRSNCSSRDKRVRLHPRELLRLFPVSPQTDDIGGDTQRRPSGCWQRPPEPRPGDLRARGSTKFVRPSMYGYIVKDPAASRTSTSYRTGGPL